MQQTASDVLGVESTPLLNYPPKLGAPQVEAIQDRAQELLVEGEGLDDHYLRLLQQTKTKLLRSVHFNVINLTKTKTSQIDVHSVQISWERRQFYIHKISHLNAEETFELCSFERQSSLEFQSVLDECSDELLEICKSNILAYLGEYLTHPYASYAVQKVIQRDLNFCQVVAGFCSENFEALVCDEFASRVMQRIVERLASFRSFVLEFFSIRLEEHLNTISAVFLLALALRSTDDHQEGTFLVQYMVEQPELMSSKYFRRLVACYLERCPHEQLAVVDNILSIRKKMLAYLNNKYSVIIVLVIMQRNYQPVVNAFIACLRSQLSLVFQTKYFKFLFSKLLERSQRAILSEIHSALTSATLPQLRNLCSLPTDGKEYFKYTVLASCIKGDGQTIDMVFKLLEGEKKRAFLIQRQKKRLGTGHQLLQA